MENVPRWAFKKMFENEKSDARELRALLVQARSLFQFSLP